MVHLGERQEGSTRISYISFSDSSLTEGELKGGRIVIPELPENGLLWIDTDRIHELESIRSLGESFSLHPLVLEDIVSSVQRPKVEDYGSYLFVVVKLLSPLPGGDFRSEQVSFLLGSNYLLTFQEGGNGDNFQLVKERIRSGKGKIRSLGADYLLYTLLDMVVDRYFTVLEGFGELMVDLEEEVALHPDPSTLLKLNELKKELIYLRKSVWPLREVLSFLERDDTELVKDSTRLFLRDVHDHTVQTIDTVETFRDLLSGMLDLYLSSISNRTNEIMKFLTIIGTIFLPLTFIVGLYGMNFRNMPELEWHYGYFAVLAFMSLISIGMIVYFRHKRWL